MKLRKTMELLNVLSPIREDESITSYDYRNYYPYNSSQLGNSEELRIPCQNSTFAHLSESCLYIEGSITDLAPEAMTIIKLVKNFPLYLFSEARLELNGQVIDSVRSPGTVSTMKNYCLQNVEEKGEASEFFWADNFVEFSNKMTKFSCCVPLKKIFGFCLDYKKIILYSKLELVLLRSRSDLDCFAEPTANAKAKINVNKVCWKIFHLDIADIYKLKMSKILESGQEISMGLRACEFYEHPNIGSGQQLTWQIKTSSGAEKPLYIIMGLQTNRKDQMDKDVTIFDHANLRDAKLFLNRFTCPYENLELNYDEDQYSNAYRMFLNFRKKYLGSGSSCISFGDYKKMCPLIVFDTTHTPLEMKLSPIDIRLELSFHKDIPATTSANVLLIFDRIINYNPFNGLVLRQV